MMEGNDVRRVAADDYVRYGIKILRAARSNHLDHTDDTTVKNAIDGLRIVQRSIASPAPADAQIAVRLRQLSIEVKSCGDPDARIAHRPLEKAAGIFESMGGVSQLIGKPG